MDLNIFFMEHPEPAALAALDRRLASFARQQEPLQGGKRLWITHMPQTQTRPFLHAKPFDLFVTTLNFSAPQMEDYRIGLGSTPKRCMVCRAAEDGDGAREVLFFLCTEVMSKCSGLLQIPESLARHMFKIDALEDEIPPHLLHEFPGRICEVAHETDDDALQIDWFVDARWLLAWLQKQRPMGSKNVEGNRFSSLDYT